MEQQTEFLVLDTNIILLDANNISTLGADGAVIILSETVVDEIDSKKSVIGELGYQARSFGRLIAKGSIETIVHSEDLTITPIRLADGTLVHITSSSSYPSFDDTSSSIINDRKIIEIAVQYSNIFGNTTFMSNDVMARISALGLGLTVTELKVTEKTSYEFVKSFSVTDPEVFRTLHNSPIVDVDPDYQVEHYSYKFTCSSTMQMKLATINNGLISILGKDTEKDIRRQDCNPSNSEQLLVSKAILDPTIDLVLVEGKAGSGKTLVTLSNLMKVMKTTRDKYDSIIYIRNPVDDVGNPDEEIGFLSTNEAKEAVYLGPIEDSLQFIVRSKMSKTKQETIPEYEVRVTSALEKTKAEYGIESIISLGLRGRTFTNSLIMLDEWQNAGANTTQKVLTRVGKDCKVVMLGSQNQIDSKYLTKFSNGLVTVMDEAATRKIDSDINMFAINLTKVQRSPMCDFAEKLFEK